MSYVLSLTNKNGDIVGTTVIDKEDFENVKNLKWYLDDGYAKGSKGLLHRFIMKATKQDSLIDHINGNKLDNRKVNLVFSNPVKNVQNRNKKKNCTSKYIGVNYDKKINKWRCSIKINTKSKCIRFDDEEHAAYWYDQLALAMHGPYAKINNLGKPDNFIEPIEKQKELPKGIRLTRVGTYQARITIDKKTITVGSFETLDQARDALERKKKELELNKQQKILLQQIIRNEDKIAIINNNLVDDDKYHDLVKYKWILNNGYYQANINGKIIKMHRYIMNAKDGEIIDRINNNKLDNRIINLRNSTFSLNSYNKEKKNNMTTDYIGVCLYKKTGKFKAGISKDNIYYYLGYYDTPEKAAIEYNKKAIELYGKDAKQNIVSLYGENS
jgi:hypothetical protein